MGDTKRQHYVPQSYLKKFSFDGKRLHTFLKRKDSPKIITENNKSNYLKDVSTADVCVKKDFYSIDKTNPNNTSQLDKLALEKEFFQDYAEPKLVSVINTFEALAQKILDNNSTIADFHLTDELKKDLALSTYIQYYRTPRQRRNLDEINNIIKCSKKLSLIENGQNSNVVKGFDVAYTHANKTFLNPYLLRMFYQKVSSYCLLLRVSPNGNFFTSDNPVVIYKLGVKGKKSLDVNFYKDEFCIFFPLTHNLMLEYYCPYAFPDAIPLNNSISVVDKQYENQVNKYQYINAEKYVFSYKNDFSLFLIPQ